MPVHRKIFRIEEQGPSPLRSRVVADETVAVLQRHEFMMEIKALRALIDPKSSEINSVSRESLERGRAQIAEAQAYKHELDLIHRAIDDTRRAIGALPPDAAGETQAGRAGRELNAIVADTETATQKLIHAAEDIDQNANTLSAALKSQHEQALANDIRDRVLQIYEACNFQDLTGQRVAKVMETLDFIDSRMIRLAEIWARVEQFKPVVLDHAPDGDDRFLNGPKLPDDSGHASQDDIDALFGRAETV